MFGLQPSLNPLPGKLTVLKPGGQRQSFSSQPMWPMHVVLHVNPQPSPNWKASHLRSHLWLWKRQHRTDRNMSTECILCKNKLHNQRTWWTMCTLRLLCTLFQCLRLQPWPKKMVYPVKPWLFLTDYSSQFPLEWEHITTGNKFDWHGACPHGTPTQCVQVHCCSTCGNTYLLPAYPELHLHVPDLNEQLPFPLQFEHCIAQFIPYVPGGQPGLNGDQVLGER